jgi:hypothetical protein
MRKPSMFSRHYRNDIKKRKRKIALLIIVPIIGFTILLTNFNSLFNNSKGSKEKSNTQVQNKPQVVKPRPSTVKPNVPPAKIALKNEMYPISLSDGQKISIEFVMKGTEKNIKGVIGGKNISYDISPSKKAIVIQSSNQDLLYVDVNKVFKDITKKTHQSSKGEVFPKEQVINEHKTYIWSITPKFVDEDNIAYVSELPWINDQAVLYIWELNLKSNAYIQVKPASGKSITFKNITPKGLEVVIDGNTWYVTSSGQVIQ